MQKGVTRTAIGFVCLVLIFGFLGAQSVVAQNEPQIKVGENSGSIKCGNQTRQFLLYVPEGYDGKTNLPLVFLFHGSGGTSKIIMENTDLSKVADKKKFIIAAPEGIYPFFGMNSWNAELDPGGVNDVELVKDLMKEQNTLQSKLVEATIKLAKEDQNIFIIF